jgi:hypothetical protein
MIAYDLQCRAGEHRFEGWFASSSEFDRQKGEGLIACPYCESRDVVKAVMAPHVGRKGNQKSQKAQQKTEEQKVPMPVSNQPKLPPEMQAAITEIAKMQSKMLEKSEWVGRQFAEEARAIHYGESQARIIHGEATPHEAQELHEEGVAIAALPLPYVPPQAKN